MKKIFFTSTVILGVLISACSTKSARVSSDSSVKVNSSSAQSSVQGSTQGSIQSGALDIDSQISQFNDNLNKVYFDFNKFNVRSDMQNVINTNADIFNTELNGVNIIVEGNCDEWGTDEYNQALGLKRAKAVKEALIAKGVGADRIAVKSYGETNPVCTEKNKACDAQNRRVEFKVSK